MTRPTATRPFAPPRVILGRATRGRLVRFLRRARLRALSALGAQPRARSRVVVEDRLAAASAPPRPALRARARATRARAAGACRSRPSSSRRSTKGALGTAAAARAPARARELASARSRARSSASPRATRAPPRGARALARRPRGGARALVAARAAAGRSIEVAAEPRARGRSGMRGRPPSPLLRSWPSTAAGRPPRPARARRAARRETPGASAPLASGKLVTIRELFDELFVKGARRARSARARAASWQPFSAAA